MSEALIFFVTPTGNRIKVFADGQLVSEYVNGTWRTGALTLIENQLKVEASRKKFPFMTLKRIVRTAFKMAGRNLGALFVLFESLEKVQGKYDEGLKNLGLEMKRRHIQTISDGELINFAKEDGALLIDMRGTIHGFRSILKPRPVQGLDFEPGIGSRHFYAQCFSADANCFAIVVSEDGTVTVFCDGKKISNSDEDAGK